MPVGGMCLASESLFLAAGPPVKLRGSPEKAQEVGAGSWP